MWMGDSDGADVGCGCGPRVCGTCVVELYSQRHSHLMRYFVNLPWCCSFRLFHASVYLFSYALSLSTDPITVQPNECHHPVYADGQICLDILQNRWSPTYNVGGILASIQSLLDEPNPNSPANSEAAKLYTENKME